MDRQTTPGVQAYVLRALAASEIAESCPEPRLRRRFTRLAGRWLAAAEREGRAARQVQGSS